MKEPADAAAADAGTASDGMLLPKRTNRLGIRPHAIDY